MDFGIDFFKNIFGYIQFKKNKKQKSQPYYFKLNFLGS